MSTGGRGKGLLVTTVLAVLLAALIGWIARNTYWDEDSYPVPLRGEAASNPFYAAERFARSLGATTERQHYLQKLPAPGAVMVITAWHWDLDAARRERLKRWVESGGRLVVDGSLISTQEEFEEWSGISRDYREADPDDGDEDADDSGPGDESVRCRTLQPDSYTACDFDRSSTLRTSRKAEWALNDEHGMQVARTRVGRGSVTVVNSRPFVYREFLEGDHAELFVATTQLRRGDDVHFFTEDDHPGLLTLLWRAAGPVVSLALAAIGLALWRRSARFGPLSAPAPTARRSLGEQIRGTGRFMLRFNDGPALQAATVRALSETALAHIAGYARLGNDERARRLAALTGHDASNLSAALAFDGNGRSPQFRNALALLESVRRTVSIRKKRTWHASGSEHDNAGG